MKKVDVGAIGCGVISGFYIETDVVSLGDIIEGRSSIEREKERGALFLSGDPGLVRSMNRWLRTSVYGALEGISQLS